jgi:tRNA(Ile)-lysidine synthetase-like protein
MSSLSSSAAELVGSVGTVLDNDLLVGVAHLLVGCSGGGDSVALVGLLRELRPELRLTLVHCDHQARADSGTDAQFVRDLAQRWELPCRVVQAPLAPGAAGSREAGWRTLRRQAFQAALEQLGADAVALGHTIDDQAETVMLNLGRGAGLRGLAAMRPRADHDGLLILRPLLGIRRQALRAYARERGYAWRRDPSNDDLRFARNRVRATVLPALEAAAPGAVGNIARLAEIAAEYQAFLDAQADAAWPTLELPENFTGGVALAADALVALPRPVAVAVLQRALRGVRGDLRGISKEHLDTVMESVAVGQQPAADLPGTRVIRAGRALRLLPLKNRRLAAAEYGESS